VLRYSISSIPYVVRSVYCR